MYTYKSLIERFMEKYYENNDNILGFSFFYMAYALTRIIKQDEKHEELKQINNKIILYKTTGSLDILYEIKADIEKKHYRHVLFLLDELKDVRPADFFDDVTNVTKSFGSFAFVIED